MVFGIDALHGWGQAARAIANCSGVIPTFTIVTGPAVSGPALLIGLSDFVIMTADSYAFVSGPTMVAEFTGIAMSTEELGGTDAHAKQSGVASLVVPARRPSLQVPQLAKRDKGHCPFFWNPSRCMRRHS